MNNKAPSSNFYICNIFPPLLIRDRKCENCKIHGVEQGERALIWSDYDRIRRDCKDYQVMHGNTTSTIISVINISVMVVIGIINHHTLQATFPVQIGVQIRTRKLVQDILGQGSAGSPARVTQSNAEHSCQPLAQQCFWLFKPLLSPKLGRM